MQFIAHRINTVSELDALPREFGVELDLRDHGDRLILQHDPFCDGDDFEDYIKNYQHGLMILNIKSERIEWRVLELIKRYSISDYFFLDSSFPMIRQLVAHGDSRVALRYSEYEKLDTILGMAGQVDWVWIDSFESLSLTTQEYQQLRSAGFKLCLVSPELQLRDDIEETAKTLKEREIVMDAICTKSYHISRWTSVL